MASFKDLPAELLYRIAHFIEEAKRNKRDTHTYLTSPVIAQSTVVDADFWRSTLARYADLRSLALTCRKARSPAQEALFRRVAVDNSIRERSYRPTSIHRFFFIILKKPHLADRVHELHVDIDPCLESHVVSVRDHEPGSKTLCPLCDHGGLCPFGRLASMCKYLLQLWLNRQRALGNCKTRSHYRFYRLLAGNMNHEYETWLSVVGILLHLLPLIQNERSMRTSALSINTHGDCHEAQELLFGDDTCLMPPLSVGFRYLTSLKTSFVPIWSVLQTLTLRKLHIVLAELEHLHYRHDEGPCNYDIPEDDECDHIIEMAIDIRAEALEVYFAGPTRNRRYGADKIIQKLQRYLPNLKNLEIRIVWKMDVSEETFNRRDQDTFGLVYRSMSMLLEVPSLMRVAIDASDVDWLNFRPEFVAVKRTPSPAHFARQYIYPFIRPWDMSWAKDRRTGGLANLKRLIVPQELLFRSFIDNQLPFHQRMVDIPVHVESLEIIDSTIILNEWAAHVLDHRHEYPSLKRVVLWCDKFANVLARDYPYEAHYGSQDDADTDDGDVDYLSVAQTAYSRLLGMEPYRASLGHVPQFDTGLHSGNNIDAVGTIEPTLNVTDIWSRMVLAGIEVIFNTDRQQGWREL